MEQNTSAFESSLLPVVPLRDIVVFPSSITPLFVVRSRSLIALEEAVARDKRIFVSLQKDSESDNPGADEIERTGTVCEVLQVLRTPDGSAKVLIEGNYTARAVEFSTVNDRYLQALTVRQQIEPLTGNRAKAMMRLAVNYFETYSRLSDKIPEDLLLTIQKFDDPAPLLNSVAHYAGIPTEEKQRILEANTFEEKYLLLHQALQNENQLLELEQTIMGQVKSNINRSQREYFLNEQMRVIERELGQNAGDDSEIEELHELIKKSGMPVEAMEKADKELRRLAKMPPLSPEATVTRTYIEWLVEVPWKKATKDKIDLTRARKILDQDHYGLDKIKDRILEHLAVVQLVGVTRGPILCFVGPPGVGKTSLATSIARSMGRKFVRMSLGGVRDEAEIRGHRRTYIGALPGKLTQLMKKAGTVNPVFLLDEIDKMSSDFRGDPASALLEVLDPEQNKAFSDHYLEVDYDLSRVMFITTANTVDGIPYPLLDRMELIRLPGYTEIEKERIATRYLIPKQAKATGLKKTQLSITKPALRLLISGYTKEAGVRNLEREIGSVCRKVARAIVTPKERKALNKITPEVLRELLGPVPHTDTVVERRPEVGIANGLAWTSVGGELLHVETTVMPGKGNLTLTGKLGEVMQESGKTALSYIRSHSKELGIADERFQDRDIHVHLPEGATPKDGPSAGVTLATSMASALSGIPVRQDLAMTGEVTLRGKVLRIGGLKEKSLAAHRLGLRQIIIPAENVDELEDIPKEVRDDVTYFPVRTLDEVLEMALVRPGQKTDEKAAKPPKATRSAGKRGTTITRPGARA